MLGSHWSKECKTRAEQTCNLEPNLTSLDQLNPSQSTFMTMRNKYLLSCKILHLLVMQNSYGYRVIQKIIVHLF